jgi:hypothetical protein
MNSGAELGAPVRPAAARYAVNAETTGGEPVAGGPSSIGRVRAESGRRLCEGRAARPRTVLPCAGRRRERPRNCAGIPFATGARKEHAQLGLFRELEHGSGLHAQQPKRRSDGVEGEVARSPSPAISWG